MSDRPMPVTLLSWKPINKGSALRGFASVQIGGLKINDVTLFTKDGRSWASLPSKPRMGAGGAPIQKDGKTLYAPICEWASKETSDRFSSALIDAINSQHPGDLE